MPGILELDPQTQGILQAAFAGLQASGPSRMPVSLGQIIGRGGQAGMATYDAAKRLDSELANDVLKRQLVAGQIAQQAFDLKTQQDIMGGGGMGAMLGDPDRLEALGQRLAAIGKPGGAAMIAAAEGIRKKRREEELLKSMQGGALKPGETTLAASEEEAQRLAQESLKSNPEQPVNIGVDPKGPGILGSLLTSPYVGAEARDLKKVIDSAIPGSVSPTDLMKRVEFLQSKHLSAAESSRKRDEQPTLRIVQDKNSPTGWSYADPQGTPRMVGAPPPATAATVGTIIPEELKDVHGEDYLKTLPVGMGEMVKGIANGSIDPTKAASMRMGNREAIMQRVMQYDPSYTSQRPTVLKDFTSGKTAQNVTAMNTVIAHMGTVKELTDALKNGDVQTVNRALNAARTEFGNPNINNAEIAIQAMANELMRVFRQVNASQHEVEAWERKFNAAKGSPEQLSGALRVAGDLLKGRLDAVNDQWKRGMNVDTDFPNLLSPKSQSAYDKLMGRKPSANPNSYSDPEKEKRYQEWLKKQSGG